MPDPSPGRRGTRPRNRRELILAAAADLFAKHGYAKVGMRDLLAWSILAVLASPSFHHLDLPRPAYEELLAALVATVIGTELPAPPAPATASPGAVPAVPHACLPPRGTARPGHAHVRQPRLHPGGPADALRRRLRSYVSLSHTHPEIFGLLITDIDHLQEEERHSIRRAQHEHVSEWAHLLRLDQPLLDPVAARIRVHAVLSVAHDTARTAHLRRNPAVPAAVVAVCTRLLGLTAGRPA